MGALTGIKPFLIFLFIKVMKRVLSYFKPEFLVPSLPPHKSLEGLALFLKLGANTEHRIKVAVQSPSMQYFCLQI